MPDVSQPAHDLLVCPRCGWYNTYNHERTCDIAAGALAREFAATSPFPVNRLGYGEGRINVEFNSNCTITLRVRDNGFEIDHVHWLERFDPDGMKYFLAMMGTFASTETP